MLCLTLDQSEYANKMQMKDGDEVTAILKNQQYFREKYFPQYKTL